MTSSQVRGFLSSKLHSGVQFLPKRYVRRIAAKFTIDRDQKETLQKKEREMENDILKDSTCFVDLQSPAMVQDRWVSSLYPRNYGTPNDKTKYTFRPLNVDPAETSVILFPGQGSQYVGMAKKLLQCGIPEVKKIFETANHILRYDLTTLCCNGPKEELDKTVHSQLGVFVCSLAALERLRVEKPQIIENCVGTAGFSSGEYAALVLAGVLSFENALKLLRIRSEAMQSASETRPSGMLTISQNFKSELKLAMMGARQWVKTTNGNSLEGEPVCSVAQFLFTECKVIGGDEGAINFVEENAEKFNLKCKRLATSGAFHTVLMKPAANVLRDALRSMKSPLSPPLINVHSNVDCEPYTRVAYDSARRLVKQVYSPVRWEQTLRALYDRDFFAERYPQTYECGPGKHLGAMLKRTHASASRSYTHYFDSDNRFNYLQ